MKRITPLSLIEHYHKFLALLGAFIYGYPSNKLIVIGVTGTKGKSTTVNLIAKILEASGHKVGFSTTTNFKVADQEWINKMKMTMPGRFFLQKLLARMVKAGCRYAIIETSSEGIKQWRHLGINYDVAVFTNLSPEHIEAHGSFENYKNAKGELFKILTQLKRKKIEGKEISKDFVVNMADNEVNYFLGFKADRKICFSLKRISDHSLHNLEFTAGGIKFHFWGEDFNLKLIGEFNAYNVAAAIAVGISQNIPVKQIKQGLEKVRGVMGRMEKIEAGQPFTVIVDYAHEPKSLEAVYGTLKSIVEPDKKIIAVLGSCGGGRDKARRPILGGIAAKYTDLVIVTNEDPYDEDPWDIINQVAEGAIQGGKKMGQDLWQILDRGKAIQKALILAQEDDLVIISGKGSEQWIMGPGRQKIAWDDRETVRKQLTTDN